MDPFLLRRIHHEDAKQGTDFIQTHIPADRYTYSHLSYQDNVEATGKLVYKYRNIFHINDNFESLWVPHIHSEWWHFCEDYDLWLRYHDGEIARFSFFGKPRLVNMGKLISRTEELAGFNLCGTGPFFLDQCWPVISDWMLDGGVHNTHDLSDYSPIAYTLGTKDFIHLMTSIDTRTFINGWNDWDKNGVLCMYENADTGSRLKDLGWTVLRWTENPGSVLEIEGGPGEKSTQKVLRSWDKHGGILGCQHPDTAKLAWEMKHAGA